MIMNVIHKSKIELNSADAIYNFFAISILSNI